MPKYHYLLNCSSYIDSSIPHAIVMSLLWYGEYSIATAGEQINDVFRHLVTDQI